MGPVTGLMFALLAAVMAYRLHDLYLGGHYVCPRCGAKRADRHASDCPWSR
jgi:hypothetical protein